LYNFAASYQATVFTKQRNILMRQDGYSTLPNSDIARYFSSASLPSQQETLGHVVVEILRSGKILNRKTLCTRLLCRMEAAVSVEEEQHYQELVRLLFKNNA